MAWYDSSGWDYFPPYLSVGEKKARGVLALAKLLKKGKRTAEPVVIAHRKRQLTSTFWGKAWADNLERYADLANRLPRGRAYLRNGSVLHLAIAGGRVEAYVAGSELYRVTIGIAPMAKARWRREVDQAELLSSATVGAVSSARPAAGKRIADDRLSAVFGIELEDAPPVRAGRPPRRGKPRPSHVSGRRR